MKIVSWNINGLISWIDSQSYVPIENLEADIVCLQETRTQRRLTALSDYCHYWNPSKKNGLHGTLTATRREPLNVIYGLGSEELDKDGHVLTVECPTPFVANCYAPRAETLERHEFRRQWDEALHSFAKKLLDTGKQVVLCGDFNALRSDIDVYPENDREHYALQGIVSDERSNLEKLLELGFVDAFRHLHPDAEGAYTWWSSRKHKRPENRGWRLDYFFVSRPAAESIKEATHLTDIHGSDHAPILLDVDALFTDQELAEEWKHTDWILAENTLEKLQQELTRAAFGRNWNKIAMFQKEIVTNPLIKRLAVREVSERTNASGIDNVRWHTAAERMQAAKNLNEHTYHASPLRQVIIIEKGSGKERHIGIPIMYDRAMHKLYDYSLKPVMEAMSESRSFGFRLKRSDFDVHEKIKEMLAALDAPEYIVRADVKAFYASIQHQWLMDHIPMDKAVLKEFLSAGHVFAGELYPREPFGISEGSSISPTLANMVLNGLQKHV